MGLDRSPVSNRVFGLSLLIIKSGSAQTPTCRGCLSASSVRSDGSPAPANPGWAWGTGEASTPHRSQPNQSSHQTSTRPPSWRLIGPPCSHCEPASPCDWLFCSLFCAGTLLFCDWPGSYLCSPWIGRRLIRLACSGAPLPDSPFGSASGLAR